MITATACDNLQRAMLDRPFLLAGTRQRPVRMLQAIVLLPLFSLILLPEYLQGLAAPETKSILYRAMVGPLRLIDALLLLLIFLHVMVWASSRRPRIAFPRELALPGLIFLAAILVSITYGALQGGSNLFFDWRALVLGIGLFCVFALWTQSAEARGQALHLFAVFMAIRIAFIYKDFANGGGDLLVGVRIPVFDGPTLSAIVFLAVLALCISGELRGWRQWLWLGLSGAAYLLVLLCFRRTFWAELGIATLLLIVMARKHRLQLLLPIALAVLVIVAILGPLFYERLLSMDFTRNESEFSQGNPDHVGEVLDAWQQIEQHPVLGIGLGRSFQTLSIQEWKEESVMVHNAPLHVWLKYGLLGLFSYAWFHIAVLRVLWKGRQPDFGNSMRMNHLGQRGNARAVRARLSCESPIGNFERAAETGALAYLAAQFLVAMGFAPWPYSSLQSATLISFILAVTLRG